MDTLSPPLSPTLSSPPALSLLDVHTALSSVSLGDIERATGLTRPHISRVLRGLSNPSVGSLHEIARAMGVREAELLEYLRGRRREQERGEERGEQAA
jgi:transcriptional regulator with XRE-family HTH domain